MPEPPANEWERQYHESIASENAARHEAWLEYEPTLSDWRSYYLALLVPAALLALALGWVSEHLGIGRGPGNVAGALIWLVILAVMVWRWGRARSKHRRAKQNP